MAEHKELITDARDHVERLLYGIPDGASKERIRNGEGADERIALVVKLTAALEDVERESRRRNWWVATDDISKGGRKIAGPFSTEEDALIARAAIEQRDLTDQYWVVDATASLSGAVAK